jgi:hypothetical protein
MEVLTCIAILVAPAALVAFVFWLEGWTRNWEDGPGAGLL